MKHNKKRNTAFLYESLIRQLTKCIVDKNNEQKSNLISILKEHFSNGTILHKELSLYKTLKETRDLSRNVAEKLMFETKIEYEQLPKDKIFQEQSKVINKINKQIGSSVFSNFVNDYKDLATISQIFNDHTPVKNRVLLEEEVVEKMCETASKKEKQMLPLDQITYNTFVNKFNDKYGDSLLGEQKELLTNYLISFSDNGLSLKIFLNEELERIRNEVNNCLNLKEIKEDLSMSKKTSMIIEKLELFKKKEFDQQMLSELLKIQHFINEAQK